MNNAQKTLVLVGLAAAIGGAILGLLPATFTTTTRTYSCGSPWFRDHSGEQQAALVDQLANGMIGAQVYGGDHRADCDDAFGSRGVFGGVIAGFGVLALLGVAFVAAGKNGALGGVFTMAPDPQPAPEPDTEA